MCQMSSSWLTMFSRGTSTHGLMHVDHMVAFVVRHMGSPLLTISLFVAQDLNDSSYVFKIYFIFSTILMLLLILTHLCHLFWRILQRASFWIHLFRGNSSKPFTPSFVSFTKIYGEEEFLKEKLTIDDETFGEISTRERC